MVNPHIEVTFGPDAPENPTAAWLLRRIPCDGSLGSWPAGTRHIEIVRDIGGGRSGGVVLLGLQHKAWSRSRCVIKIDRTHLLAQEWRAYEEHVKSLNSGLFAPISAATPEVVTGDATGDPGAIVYGEASEYTGQPGDSVQTLEELVAAAVADPARLAGTLDVLDRVLRAAATALHSQYRPNPHAASLRSLNPTLGPNLALAPDDGDAEWLVDDLVLRRTLGGFDTDIQPGDRIELRDLTPDDRTLTGQDIKITYKGGAHDPKSVTGMVISSRGAERRALLLAAVRPVKVTATSWHVDGATVADPFTALEQVLTETSSNRVHSFAHGDFNAGNVVVVGNHPCFIDYARTTRDAPQQSDYAWLEVALLRDVFAGCAFTDIVRVQRALAVAGKLLQLGASAREARERGLDLLDDGPATAFVVLFTVRARAHACYPHEQAGPEWWRDHLCHLLLSAHRTLKWTGPVQSDAKLLTMAAVAAVATEWLTDRSPFAHWMPSDRDRATAGLRPWLVRTRGTRYMHQLLADLQPDHDGFIDLVAEDHRLLGTESSLAPRSALAQAMSARVGVLTGRPGSGKTRLLRECAYLTAREGTLVPLLLDARNHESPLMDRDTLATGAVRLFVDGLDDSPDRAAALATLHRLHDEFPELAILVCSRENGDLSFPEIRLEEFDEDAILAHLHRNAPASAVPGLLHTLLDDPLWTPLDIRRPRSMALLTEHLRAGELPPSPHALHERMLRSALGEEGFSRAAEIAALLLDDSSAEPDDKLVMTGIFVRDHDSIRIAEPPDRDFLAAHALRGRPVSVQIARAAEPAWHNALRMLVSDPESDSDVVRQVVSSLIELDPLRAGELLRAAHRPPADLLSRFVHTHQDELRSGRDAGGLRALADPEAIAAVVRDEKSHDNARVTGLALLEWLTDHARPGAEHRAARAALTGSVQAVLQRGASANPRVQALGSIKRQRLRGLELHAEAHLATTHPWPVVRSAAEALGELGVNLPEPARAAYHEAARERLADLVGTLQATTDIGAARRLRNERIALVELLAGYPSGKDVLLRHRFAFDVTDLAPILDPHLPAITPADPDTWLAQVARGTSEEAFEATHRLLRDAPARIGDLLLCASLDPCGHHLLIAAATVTSANAEQAAEIFTDLMPTAAADLFEGLSALLVAIFRADRARGVRLAWLTARAFAVLDLPERHFWPWKIALARCRGSLQDHEDLLLGDPNDIPLAIDALASWDVLGTDNPGPGRLSDRAREALWLQRPQLDASPEAAESWARAAAAVQLDKAVPHLRMLAAKLEGRLLKFSTNTGIVESSVTEVLLSAVARLTARRPRGGSIG